jgi:hypothetical protein
MNWYKKMEPPGSIFWDYFNCADECFSYGTDNPGLVLSDLDEEFVTRAKLAAQQFQLPWPPYLPVAEEALNDMNRYQADHQKR